MGRVSLHGLRRRGQVDGETLATAPLGKRRKRLEKFYARHRSHLLRLSPMTVEHDVATRWLEGTGSALDGVIAKRTDEPYQPGKREQLAEEARPEVVDRAIVGV